jgi:hypothetical protein
VRSSRIDSLASGSCLDHSGEFAGKHACPRVQLSTSAVVRLRVRQDQAVRSRGGPGPAQAIQGACYSRSRQKWARCCGSCQYRIGRATQARPGLCVERRCLRSMSLTRGRSSLPGWRSPHPWWARQARCLMCRPGAHPGIRAGSRGVTPACQRLNHHRAYAQRYYAETFSPGRGLERLLELLAEHATAGSWLDLGAGPTTLRRGPRMPGVLGLLPGTLDGRHVPERWHVMRSGPVLPGADVDVVPVDLCPDTVAAADDLLRTVGHVAADVCEAAAGHAQT